jgi:CBS domain-containing protein
MSTVQLILDAKGYDVACIPQETTVLDAAREMSKRKIGCLVVMEGTRLKGIITERDILRRLVAEECDPRTTSVDEIMTHEIHACRRDTKLSECRALVTEKRIRYLPVIEDDQLKGIITIGDLVKHEIKEKEEVIGYLHEYLYQGEAPST